MALNQDDMYRETNALAMQYAKYAIQFSFLLNGAGATALFAKVDNIYTSAACIFGFGAFFAVTSMGISYVAQMLLAETWRQDPNDMQIYFLGKWRRCNFKHAERMRCISALFWIISMILTFSGVCVALLVK